MSSPRTSTEPRVRTTIKIDRDIHRDGKALADSERRNFSNFVEVLIEREKLRRKGARN